MTLLVGAIALGGAGQLANTLFGWNGDDLTPEWLADHRHAWIAATFGNAFLALGLIALVIAICVLVRGRGAGWATTGLVLGSVGAVLHAVSAAIPTVVADEARLESTQTFVALPSFLLLTLTQIVVTVALVRSRAVPMWVPVVFLVSGLLGVVFAGSGALTAALALPQIVAMVAIGWFARAHATPA